MARNRKEKIDVTEALSIVRNEYYKDVSGLADYVVERVQEEGEDVDLHDILHEIVDGSQRVIYTHQAMLGVVSSDNDSAMWDEGLNEGVDFSSGIPWSQIMYSALMQDIYEELDSRGLDPNDVESWFEDDED